MSEIITWIVTILALLVMFAFPITIVIGIIILLIVFFRTRKK